VPTPLNEKQRKKAAFSRAAAAHCAFGLRGLRKAIAQNKPSLWF